MMRLIYTIVSAVFHPIFLIMSLVTYLLYKKTTLMERQILTFSKTTVQRKVIDAVLHGIVTGLLGSWFIQGVGLSLEVTKGLMLMLPIAILLSFKNPRFACFSYAAAILGVISIVVPRLAFDIPGMIALVGHLHLMEAVLVYFTGSQGSVPVMTKSQGEYVGAYVMQKYWPIPIALLTPLQGLVPLCGILGFASIAITRTPEKKARKMGLLIGIYALLIIIGAKIANKYPPYQLLILFLMPLFHETVYYLDGYVEKNKPALYKIPNDGVRVLDVQPGGYGSCMGIKRGDIIHQINQYDIGNPRDYYKSLKEGHLNLRLKVSRLNGKEEILECHTTGSIITNLGIVPLPKHAITMLRFYS